MARRKHKKRNKAQERLVRCSHLADETLVRKARQKEKAKELEAVEKPTTLYVTRLSFQCDVDKVR